MSKISATIIADSLSPQGHRITTILGVIPRIVLAEAKTHRILGIDDDDVEILYNADYGLNTDTELSRNSASSRAISSKKMIQSVMDDPFIPIAWQKEHTGMQGYEYFTGEETINAFRYNHLLARDAAVTRADIHMGMKGSKQIANRYLEPFMWHTVLITATEWDNFFELRCPQYVSPVGGKDDKGNDWIYRSKKDLIASHSNPDNLNMLSKFTETDWLKINKSGAEIHIAAFAEAVWDAMNESKPVQLKEGGWHIPFGNQIDLLAETYDTYETWISRKIKISTAMAARTSYTTVGDEKEISYERLIGIHDKMAEQVPFHASPFEHCAKAMNQEEYYSHIKGKLEIEEFLNLDDISLDIFYKGITDQSSIAGWCRNFRGFIQYREIREKIAYV